MNVDKLKHELIKLQNELEYFQGRKGKVIMFQLEHEYITQDMAEELDICENYIQSIMLTIDKLSEKLRQKMRRNKNEEEA